jgi:hypothetical protein
LSCGGGKTQLGASAGSQPDRAGTDRSLLLGMGLASCHAAMRVPDS